MSDKQQSSEAKKPWKAVYVIRDAKDPGDKGFWTQIGRAFTNQDGSLTVLLDALPANGRLHIRDRRMGDEEAA